MRWFLIFGSLTVLSECMFAQVPTWTKGIYRLESICADKRYVATAFKLKGEGGLLTALHAVVGCQKFTVISAEGEQPITEPLALEWANIDSDLAILTTPTLKQRLGEGLELGDVSALRALQTLRAPGFAYSLISTMESQLIVTNDAQPKRLEQILPEFIRPSFRRRGSPDLGAQGLRLQGPLAKGQSGAPIIDNLNRVIAVVNGGAGRSESNYVWGMILERVGQSVTSAPGWQKAAALKNERWQKLVDTPVPADSFYADAQSRAQTVTLERVDPKATAHFFRTPDWAILVYIGGRKAFTIDHFTERANNVLRNFGFGTKRVDKTELAKMSGGLNPTIITSCEIGSQIRLGVSLIDNLTRDGVPYALSGETLLPCDETDSEFVTDLQLERSSFWNRAKFVLRMSTSAYKE